MHRRTLLTVVSLSAATVAGCTGKPNKDTDENDEREYEECNHRILHYQNLPEDVRSEVDTALSKGQYETDEK